MQKVTESIMYKVDFENDTVTLDVPGWIGARITEWSYPDGSATIVFSRRRGYE